MTDKKILTREQLFELFFQDVTVDMNPAGIRQGRAMYEFWRLRFMEVMDGTNSAYRSWNEAPRMWLKGYFKEVN